MKIKSLRLFFIYFFLYIITPTLFLEIFAQFTLRNQLGENSYLFRTTKNNKSFMHIPSSKRDYKFKTLYDWENNPNGTKVSFKTDIYGTIEPSSLEKVNKKNLDSILFCGGSSIENAYVKEGKRIPDIFSEISKLESINASKSGKDLKDCILTIDYILKNTIKPPKFILIATNVNTLGNFALKRIQKLNDNYKTNDLQRIKKSFKKYFPGLYKSLSLIKRSNSYLSKILSPRYSKLSNQFNKYEVVDKEYLLGCCSISSKINSNNNIGFNWEEAKNKTEYSLHLNKYIKALDELIIRTNFNKNNVLIFIEPNSYHLKKIASKYDFRKKQLLFDKNGNKYTLKETSFIYDIYDSIYEKQFLENGFRVIEKPFISDEDIFYDSVHFTKYGSFFIGNYILNNLNLLD